MNSGEIKRIFIWSTPRSVSTAFMRCFMNRGSNTKTLLEPFLKSYYFSEERLSDRYGDVEVMPNAQFKQTKSYLEALDDSDFVVVKDMGFYMKGRTHLPDAIPDGYIYMFLIRHPAKAITSLHNLIASGKMEGWTEFFPEETSYKELAELYDLVSKKMGVAPVVVDADDLLENPESMLRRICTEAGISYRDEMLNWGPVTENQMEEFKEWIPFVKKVLDSDCLEQKPASPAPDVSQLPDDVQKTISDAMPYYEELHHKRLTL